MSLPGLLNQRMQHRVAEKALSVNRMIASVEAFLEEQYQSEIESEQLAEKIAPSPNFCLARILYRTPDHFNSFVWINKGSEESPLIKKNSPVLAYDSLVGVVEYVGAHASSVRLITDSSLTPAVRVERNRQDPAIRFAINLLQDAADEEELPFSNHDEKIAFIWMLQHIKEQQKPTASSQFLAKGILQGQGRSGVLKGSGFNYDFKDGHGPGRDLRSGTILQVGDTLVTSGLDGIFPEGLKVAKISSIAPLTEGAYAYELQATPTALDMQNLDFVTILPPQDFDRAALPSQLELILNQIN